MITGLLKLACNHKVPMSLQSLGQNGEPARWWCPSCRKSSDVLEVLYPTMKEA